MVRFRDLRMLAGVSRVSINIYESLKNSIKIMHCCLFIYFHDMFIIILSIFIIIKFSLLNVRFGTHLLSCRQPLFLSPHCVHAIPVLQQCYMHLMSVQAACDICIRVYKCCIMMTT